MIQVRNNLFETNSSSADVMSIPKNQYIRVPERFIYMDDETSLRPSERAIYRIIHGYGYTTSSENIDKIVNFIYGAGVREIIYGGPAGDEFARAIERYKGDAMDMGLPNGWSKEELMGALFDPNAEINHYRDGEDRPEDAEDDDYWYWESYNG